MTNSKNNMEKMILGIFLFAGLFFPGCAGAETKIWILGGQSLMAGCCHTNEDLPLYYSPIPENVIAYSDEGSGLIKLSAFTDQFEWGPEVTFAWAVSQYWPEDIHVIVKVSIGGTTMDRWKPGGDLYKCLIRDVRFVMKEHKGKLTAVLWDQGQSDAGY